MEVAVRPRPQWEADTRGQEALQAVAQEATQVAEGDTRMVQGTRHLDLTEKSGVARGGR